MGYDSMILCVFAAKKWMEEVEEIWRARTACTHAST
jgi:hypothetical protein